MALAGYYRCFIPNFSSLAAPLTDLTKKGQPEKVLWGPTEEEALRRVKESLTSEPVLRAPDFNCPFLLQTDTSDTGLGAVLSQIQDGEEHPVIYISRKLTPAEQRYTAWRGSWRSRTSTLPCTTGRGRPMPTPMPTDSRGYGQLSQVCQGSPQPQPQSPPCLAGPGRRLGGGGGGV